MNDVGNAVWMWWIYSQFLKAKVIAVVRLHFRRVQNIPYLVAEMATQ